MSVAASITVKLVIDDYMAIEDTVTSPTFTAVNLAYSVSYNSSFMGDPVSLNISLQYLPI